MICPLPTSPRGAAAVDDPAAARRPRLLDEASLAELVAAVKELLETGPDLEPALAGAVRDTLAVPGSLWRAQLAWRVAEAHGLPRAAAIDLATAVEAFHTASLLFDDLPSMDDAETRRGRPCVHRTHGEASALLAALGFVHRGYARAWRALEAAAPDDRSRAAELLESCLGLAGVLDGQARDLRFSPQAEPAEEVLRIARDKTVTLLRLALELPAIVAGAPVPVREALGRLADAWGLAYQILDDLEDAKDGGPGPSVDGRLGRPNLALAIGPARAARRVDRELAVARRLTAVLGESIPALRVAFDRLTARLEAGRRREAPAGPVAAPA